jgi:hypothetical protein
MNNRMTVYWFQNVPALLWFLTRKAQPIYLFTKIPRPALRPTQPLIQCAAGFFLEGKTVGHDADHSPPSSDEVKNEWSYTSIQPNLFMAWTGSKVYFSFRNLITELCVCV